MLFKLGQKPFPAFLSLSCRTIKEQVSTEPCEVVLQGVPARSSETKLPKDESWKNLLLEELKANLQQACIDILIVPGCF